MASLVATCGTGLPPQPPSDADATAAIHPRQPAIAPANLIVTQVIPGASGFANAVTR